MSYLSWVWTSMFPILQWASTTKFQSIFDECDIYIYIILPFIFHPPLLLSRKTSQHYVNFTRMGLTCTRVSAGVVEFSNCTLIVHITIKKVPYLTFKIRKLKKKTPCTLSAGLKCLSCYSSHCQSWPCFHFPTSAFPILSFFCSCPNLLISRFLSKQKN